MRGCGTSGQRGEFSIIRNMKKQNHLYILNSWERPSCTWEKNCLPSSTIEIHNQVTCYEGNASLISWASSPLLSLDQISPGFTRSLLAHYVSLTMNLSYWPSLALPLCLLKSRSPHILTSSWLKRAIPSPLAPFVLDSLVPLRTGSFLSFFWIHSPITKENQSLHAPCCMAFLFKEAHLGRLCVMKPGGSNRPTK